MNTKCRSKSFYHPPPVDLSQHAESLSRRQSMNSSRAARRQSSFHGKIRKSFSSFFRKCKNRFSTGTGKSTSYPIIDSFTRIIKYYASLKQAYINQYRIDLKKKFRDCLDFFFACYLHLFISLKLNICYITPVDHLSIYAFLCFTTCGCCNPFSNLPVKIYKRFTNVKHT